MIPTENFFNRLPKICMQERVEEKTIFLSGRARSMKKLFFTSKNILLETKLCVLMAAYN